MTRPTRPQASVSARMDSLIVMLLAVLGGAVVALLLAPLESLEWWAGWHGDGLHMPAAAADAPYKAASRDLTPVKRHYLVFLDGIAKTGSANYHNVQMLLDALGKSLPEAVVLGDVMPYSVTNTSLTEGRPMSRFWQRALNFKVRGKHPLVAFTINIRNLFQVLVSADKRYGPVYNQGEAQLIFNSLLRSGYQPGSGVAVTLIGYSGGSQIGLGAAPYLECALHAPIILISLGGVMGSDRGLEVVQHLYHLVGSKDTVHKLGAFVFPGRWPILPNSFWNRARRRNKISVVPMGPIEHDGPGSYLDHERCLASGQSFLGATVEVVTRVVRKTSTRLNG